MVNPRPVWEMKTDPTERVAIEDWREQIFKIISILRSPTRDPEQVSRLQPDDELGKQVDEERIVMNVLQERR
jgi:hypothetical protein